MAESSAENPQPLYNSPTFIPEIWVDFAGEQGIGGGSGTITNFSTTSIVGQILMLARTSTPNSNFLFCDGSFYPNTQYPELFAIIGYTYGQSGEQFAVPNLINKTFVGADITTSNPLVTNYQSTNTANSGNFTLDINQLATHTHSVSLTNSTFVTSVGFNQSKIGEVATAFNNQAPINVNIGPTQNDLGATAGNTGISDNFLPPFFVCNYAIRAK
jgi:microcystin-dependent protein